MTKLSCSQSRFLPSSAQQKQHTALFLSVLIGLMAVAAGCGKLNSDKRNSSQNPTPVLQPEGENKNPPAPLDVPKNNPEPSLPQPVPEPALILESKISKADYKGAQSEFMARIRQAAVFYKTTVQLKNQTGADAGTGVAEIYISANDGAPDTSEMRFSITESTTGKTVLRVVNSQVSKSTLENFLANRGGSVALCGKVGKLLPTDLSCPAVTLSNLSLQDRIVTAANEPSVQLSFSVTVPDPAGADLLTLEPIFSWNAAERETVTTARVGEYNIENMWDDNDDVPTEYNDYSPKTSNWLASNMVAIKVHHVARAIALAQSPDVVVLSEIESSKNGSRSLVLLQPALESLGYRFFALGKQNPDNPTAVTNAIISKFPILKNERLDFRASPELASSARDPQVVTLDVQGNPLRVYASHWKSRGGKNQADLDAGEAMRLAAATLIKSDINAEREKNPTLDVIVAGDLNAYYNENSVVAGLSATGNELEMTAAEGTKALYNLWYEIPAPMRGSYSFSGKIQTIDNMLVNDALFDNVGLQLQEKSFRVVGEIGLSRDILMNGDGTPLRWQVQISKIAGADYNTHIGKGYSDHLPHVAEFKLMPKTEAGAVAKMALAAPSTEAVSNADQRSEAPEACSVQEYIANLSTFELAAAESESLVGQCVTLTSANLKLSKADRDSAFKIGNTQLVLSVVKSFGANQEFYRKQLQRSAGKFTLKAITGRLGYSDGKLAVFADSPQSIELEAEITH